MLPASLTYSSMEYWEPDISPPENVIKSSLNEMAQNVLKNCITRYMTVQNCTFNNLSEQDAERILEDFERQCPDEKASVTQFRPAAYDSKPHKKTLSNLTMFCFGMNAFKSSEGEVLSSITKVADNSSNSSRITQPTKEYLAASDVLSENVNRNPPTYSEKMGLDNCFDDYDKLRHQKILSRFEDRAANFPVVLEAFNAVRYSNTTVTFNLIPKEKLAVPSDELLTEQAMHYKKNMASI